VGEGEGVLKAGPLDVSVDAGAEPVVIGDDGVPPVQAAKRATAERVGKRMRMGFDSVIVLTENETATVYHSSEHSNPCLVGKRLTERSNRKTFGRLLA
jgi:hypothetical protein